MPEQMINEAKALLAERSYRLTHERQAILNVLVDTHGTHPTADDIYMATRAQHPDIGLATVYRALDLFSQVGIVLKSDLGGGSARYELNPGLSARAEEDLGSHLHHHLVCFSCGKVIEFNEDLLEDLEREVSKRTGFRIIDHKLTFSGYCEECQKKAAKVLDA